MATKKQDAEDMVLEFEEVEEIDEPLEEESIEEDLLEEALADLRAAVEDAEDLIESDFEADRERAQKYYNGDTDLPSAGENRSKYVATKVRDTIRMMKPDIMRVLCGAYRPVEFLPSTAAQAPLVEQQTTYVTQLFHRLGGYKTIYDAAHTACLHKLGVVKVYYDRKKTPQYASYTNLTEDQLNLLMQDETVQVIIDGERQRLTPGPEGMVQATVYDVDVVSFKEVGKVCMQAIPIEDFIIDENADDDRSFRVIGHRRNVTVSEGVSMGFDRDRLMELDEHDPESDDAVGLSEQRRGYIKESDEGGKGVAKKFLLTEAYFWADLDDIGVLQLYRFWLGGTAYKYLDHERVDDHPFALFAIDPEPFTVYGKSIYDISHKDQDVMTSLMRATIDNAHMSNNPRIAHHETLVNQEDVLNTDIGAPIRHRGAGNIQVVDVPFTGGQLLPLLQYLDDAIDNKIGVTRASVGLDPGALQSTDKQAVENTIAKQAGQVELAVRNLAETGMKRLFRMLLKLTMENPDPVAVMKVSGQYIEAPLDSFDPEMDMEVSVGIGTGTMEQRVMALEAIGVQQEKVLQMLGPGNPLVSLGQLMNTVEDRASLTGIHNISRYFSPVTPEMEAQIAEQMQKAQQAQQQGQPDPTQGIIAAEQIKAQTKMQSDQQKYALDEKKAAAQHEREMVRLQSEQNYKVSDAMRRDDLDRDKMIQDLYLQLAQIQAQMGVQVETAQINADVQREQATNNAGQQGAK